MRKKEMKIIVTFPTTTAAMAMERKCEEYLVVGRLIPVPRAISAGCGLSWCGAPETRDEVEAIIREYQIQTDGIFECLA